MRVEQFYAMNQFHIYDNLYDVLQSYDSTVVKIKKANIGYKEIMLGRDWDYSTTTSKYVYMFLEEYGDINFYGITNKRNYVRKLIEDGTIIYNEEMR